MSDNTDKRETWPARLKELVESAERGENAFHFIQQPQLGIHDLHKAFMAGPAVARREVVKLARHIMAHHDYFGLGEAKEELGKATMAAWAMINAWSGQKKAAAPTAEPGQADDGQQPDATETEDE